MKSLLNNTEIGKMTFPNGSIKHGEPIFNLKGSLQPGTYYSEIWINPGEAGMIYLKAFEEEKGTALSSRKLKKRTNEWVGWSNNPKELFFSNTPFSIYEGEIEKPYAARFEIWFRPDSGKADRKLMEKVFEVEGWRR
ncbi:hypothetical protein OAA91_01380 [Fibrobacterales bacterium]|nr:hypothetical protein [Fibrobacterales bacterium]